MKYRPRLIPSCALALASIFLLSACGKKPARDVLKIGIARNLTHIAVGQKSRLTAYEEYREAADIDSASAASGRDFSRAAVAAKWSVSDGGLASVNDDGTFTALKPGRVTLKSAWEGREASMTVEVVKFLPGGWLPQIKAQATRCAPQGVGLSLDKDRQLRFELTFDGGCADLSFNAPAPDKPLPWEFTFQGGALSLTS